MNLNWTDKALDTAHAFGDAVSVSVLVATFFDWVPHATALVTLIWFCLRVYEMQTVQRWLYGDKALHIIKRETDDETE